MKTRFAFPLVPVLLSVCLLVPAGLLGQQGRQVSIPSGDQMVGPVDAKIYPDAGNAFENPTHAGGYKPADASDAEHRASMFLREQLHPGQA